MLTQQLEYCLDNSLRLPIFVAGRKTQHPHQYVEGGRMVTAEGGDCSSLDQLLRIFRGGRPGLRLRQFRQNGQAVVTRMKTSIAKAMGRVNMNHSP